MKIAIDARKLQDFGIGTHLRNVVLHAAQLDSSANQYYFLCDPRDQKNSNGIGTWIAEKSSKYSLMEHYSLARQAKELGIEVFHSPHYTLPLLWSGRSIVTIHDLIHFKFREYFPAWKVKAAEIVIRKAVGKADVVLTVSETSKRDILDFIPAASDKIEVLYNRLDSEWFEEVPKFDLGTMGISSEFLLYVGNFKKHKGIDTLVEAYSRLKNPPQLVLIGKANELDLDTNDRILALPGIRLLGFAERELLQQFYSQCLFFVMPSLYEGFGYPPLEAMGCGAAVLSSDAPALLEVLGSGVEFFARGNAEALAGKMEMMLQNETRRRELSALGREHARRFATEDSPRRLLQIYRSLSK